MICGREQISCPYADKDGHCTRSLLMNCYAYCGEREKTEIEKVTAKVNESYQDQEAKADAGKPQLTLVPRQIIRAIAAVRMYGNSKYGDPDNWRTVEVERYRDALFRHLLAYLDDPQGKDEESGLPHLWHIACNVAFLCEMEDK